MKPTETNQEQQVISGSVANAIQMCVGFGALMVVSRFVPASELGVYFLLLSVVKIVDGPVTGVMSGTTKRFSEDGSEKPEIVGLTILTVFGGTLFAALVFFILDIADIVNHPILGVTLFITMLMSKSLLTVLTGTGLVGLKSQIELGRTVLRAVIWVGVVSIGYHTVGLVAGTAFASLVSVPFVFVALPVPSIPSRETIRSVWNFSKYTIPRDIIFKASDNINTVVISILIGTSAVATYELMLRLTLPALLVTSVMSTSLRARVSELDSFNDSYRDEVRKITSFSSALAIPLLFGTIVLGDVVPQTFFGSQYDGLGLVVVLAAVYRLLQTQNSPLGSVIEGSDRPYETFKISAVTGITMITLSAFGAYLAGITGVFIGMIGASALKAGLLLRLVPEFDLTSHHFTQIVAGSLMLVIIWAVTTIFGFRNWMWIVGYIGLGSFIYAFALFLIDSDIQSIVFRYSRQYVQ